MKYIKVLYTGLVGVLLAACTNETFNQESGEGTGYLRLSLGHVDVELSATTRAETSILPENLIPSASDFMVDIQKDGISIEGFPKLYSDVTGEIELAAGSYTVKADYGENEQIQDTPYFSGSSTVQIYPGKPTEATINASLANAMLVPSVSESLQNHYSAWTLTIKSGDLSIKLADNENADSYLFAQAGQPVNAAFEGTNILGNKSSHEWKVIPSAAAQTKYVIQCEPDLSIFSNIQLTATATHTYAEGTLTGTDVALNLAANGAPLELVDGWNIQLLYNNTAIRTYTSKPENGTLMDVTDGWPYVPHASTLAASIHLKTGEMINLTSVAIEEIPDPEFSTTVSANTSYSVYKSSGADAANTKDGSSIFDINATATIASEISGNPNYSDILKVTYTTDSGQSSEELPFGTATQFNSLAWQKHALSATVSFDGVEKTSMPLDCHVTGLPYKAAPPRNINSDPLYGWTEGEGNAFNWENDYLQLGVSAGQREHTVYKTYYIPTDINVNISAKIAAHNAPVETICSILIGDETVMSVNSNGSWFDYNTNTVESTVTKIMTTSSNVVTLKNSYSVTSSWGRIYYINILYR